MFLTFTDGGYMVRDSLGGRNMFRPYIDMFLKLSITYFATTTKTSIDHKFYQSQAIVDRRIKLLDLDFELKSSAFGR